jgi:aminoglycoside 6'-N-acetyltransferase I
MFRKRFDPSRMIIRPMTDKDINTFCFLFQRVFSQEPWNENWTVTKIDTGIKRQMKKKGFVGMAASTPRITVGYLTGFRLWLIPSIFYIDQLFVSTDYQRLKIGKRLLDETERHLKSRGISCIILLTKPGSYVENFYLKNGYKPLLRLFHIKGKFFLYKCKSSL